MGKAVKKKNFRALIGEALEGRLLEEEEISSLLQLDDEESLSELFKAARESRSAFFGNKIYLYGFIYYSNWCRNSCIFCNYRSANHLVKRYRKTTEEIVDAAVDLARSGVHLLDLTMGEDPHFYQSEDKEEILTGIIRTIREKVDLPLMISPGVVSRSLLSALKKEGTEWYACYQETHNRELFAGLRPGQDYDLRMEMKRFAKKLGFLIEEGLLTGVGESSSDIARSLLIMDELGAQQVRVMSFVPQKGTPLEHSPRPDVSGELKIIAIMRLLYPDRLIPASLDVDGINGLNARIAAGANVVTSLIPPNSGLMGVSNSTLEVDQGYRTAAQVKYELAKAGMQAAGPGDYREWLSRQS